jgi:hypothetical protein
MDVWNLPLLLKLGQHMLLATALDGTPLWAQLTRKFYMHRAQRKYEVQQKIIFRIISLDCYIEELLLCLVPVSCLAALKDPTKGQWV